MPACYTSKIIDMVGQKSGRWTVISFDRIKYGKAYWVCQCECGNTKSVYGRSIRIGLSNSCGCIAIEKPAHLIHGMSKTKFYRRWRAMINRCTNERQPHYERYGGRGIRVCKRWLLFLNFYEDMYESFITHSRIHGERDTTLERNKNNGHYKKDNCRWATYLEQAQNKRKTYERKVH